jgi:hypothetical protein
MNQGTQGYRLTKKPKGRKSRETVPLSGGRFSMFPLLKGIVSRDWKGLQMV